MAMFSGFEPDVAAAHAGRDTYENDRRGICKGKHQAMARAHSPPGHEPNPD
jgi:hypothetical protein